MRVVIQENYDKMCKWAADYIAAKIKAHNAGSEASFPSCSAFRLALHRSVCTRSWLVMNQAGELSFANVVTFNMDEYLGLPHEHDQSLLVLYARQLL
jgi:glucosamine-6-phosphate deaminase